MKKNVLANGSTNESVILPFPFLFLSPSLLFTILEKVIKGDLFLSNV